MRLSSYLFVQKNIKKKDIHVLYIMTKFSSKRGMDEYELLNYKIEVMERRIDTLEHLILNTKSLGVDSCTSSSTNNDLLQLLMTLIKQQIPPQSVVGNGAAIVPDNNQSQENTVQNAIVSERSAKADTTVDENTKNPFSLFTSSRRSTLI